MKEKHFKILMLSFGSLFLLGSGVAFYFKQFVLASLLAIVGFLIYLDEYSTKVRK